MLHRECSLIYCVANSLFNLTTPDGQLRCFERVAQHLAPGGVFLVQWGGWTRDAYGPDSLMSLATYAAA